MNDDDGMRIVRGKGNWPKVKAMPVNLGECEPGKVVLIAVRVAAHLAGAGKGPYTDTLLRAYDLDTKTELFACGDPYIKRSGAVRVYDLEDVR